jgi:hypothetical protein
MIFRSRKRRTRSLEPLFEEIDALSHSNQGGDANVARRILQLRHRAGLELIERPEAERPKQPEPAFDELPDDSGVPEVAPSDVTPELLRAAILRSGCLLIRGAIDRAEAVRLTEEIDRSYDARDAHSSGQQWDKAYYDEFVADSRFDLATERELLGAVGRAGLMLADSPQVSFEALDAFERAGLQRLATEFLGERTAISVNKSHLRKVSPKLFEESLGPQGSKASAWH